MEEVSENVNSEITREEEMGNTTDSIDNSSELKLKQQEVETDDFSTMLEQSKPNEGEGEEKSEETETKVSDELNQSQNNDNEEDGNQNQEINEQNESPNTESNENNEQMDQDQEQNEEEQEEEEDSTKRKKRKDKKEKKSKKEKKKKDDKKKKNKEEKSEIAKSLEHDIFGSSGEEDNGDKDEDQMQNDEDDDIFDDVDAEETKEKLKKLASKKKSEKRKKREKDSESKKKRRKGDEEENPEIQEEGENQYEEAPVSKEKGFFDEFIDSMKSGRASGRRKKKSEEEQRETINLVEDFKVKMDIAMEDDRAANQQGKPALKKLMMITEVCNTLEKKNLQNTFIENDILGTIKKWLEPLPDKSLPNLKIRENLLRVLLKFPPIETEDLRDSGIGKVIMFLTKHPLETPLNKKAAQQLIERWSRPIFGISEKYQNVDTVYDADINTENNIQETEVRTNSQNFDLSSELDRGQSRKKEVIPVKDSPTYHARIPDKIALDFKIRPKSKVSLENSHKKTKRTIEKNLNQKKGPTMVPGRGMIKRAIPISIEGRNMSH